MGNRKSRTPAMPSPAVQSSSEGRGDTWIPDGHRLMTLQLPREFPAKSVLQNFSVSEPPLD